MVSSVEEWHLGKAQDTGLAVIAESHVMFQALESGIKARRLKLLLLVVNKVKREATCSRTHFKARLAVRGGKAHSGEESQAATALCCRGR